MVMDPLSSIIINFFFQKKREKEKHKQIDKLKNNNHQKEINIFTIFKINTRKKKQKTWENYRLYAMALLVYLAEKFSCLL